MDRIFRTAVPLFLNANYKMWGLQYYNLRFINPAAQFNWYMFNGTRVNHLLVPELQSLTNFHCSFCDKKEIIEYVNEPTIEHFRPKTLYPLISYYWGNLFLCCTSCQRKGDEYNKLLLKPDTFDYTFDDYFIIDWPTGFILPKHNDPHPNFFRADVTIELYGLNKGGRPKARMNELKAYLKTTEPNIEDFSYRFYILKGL
ncbi:hypothetical protein [Flavobacterium sp. LM4]|uniref:hypothetical protein n=1 Tax=Flavobacterium sp. LM4 TaxID=1938609 RepID=UPI000994311E|nr:hypothetical protein [Flavobacterium sp. LM4]OOV17327.1 hypothetical protein BXU10_14570 [Flavobacterium sp. LM4]